MKYQSLRVLTVDDSKDDVFLLLHHIKKNGFSLIHEHVDDAPSMKKALQERRWDIIICDYDMPRFDVPSAIAILRASQNDIPLIVVSGTSDKNAIQECMHLGARDYITKNNLSRLCPAITRELNTTEIKNKCQWLENELKQTIDHFQKIFGATLQFMVSAIEARDPFKNGHQLRSANLAGAIAEEMGLNQETVDGIRFAGSIHDIGSLITPAELLAKPAKLTDVEFSLIKEHPRNGYDMIKDVESSWPLAQIIHQHHERMDGSGYPQNLKGDDILTEARILAVSDVVESMASRRSHRQALGIEAALSEIQKNMGILYDTIAAKACLTLFHEKGYQLF